MFVNSMSDLFYARVPLAFVRQVFQVMADTPQHTYQVLTVLPIQNKSLGPRPGRLPPSRRRRRPRSCTGRPRPSELARGLTPHLEPRWVADSSGDTTTGLCAGVRMPGIAAHAQTVGQNQAGGRPALPRG
ncbi:DUF5131 family protein [[Kitasatospora] papulosa]|uniref:DUF5131 family protein n=1 Tax=[Kitasatospora] papulosa TaxID=1464011 RepID=UPI003687416E